MQALTIKEIAEAIGCGGSPAQGTITQISTDSRQIPKDCLFVALEGERFDGHDYIACALEKGAAYAVAHKKGNYDSQRVLYVKNTQKALLDIGRLYRNKFQIRCVGITGSVGKTTTKDMIAQVVSAEYHTLKTQGNLNNEIGLPKTLFELDNSYEAAVIEMGMSGFGEIRRLAQVAQPQIGVITNIGVSHIEMLGSRENILKAKLELAEVLPDGAPLILCGDNDLLSKVKDARLDVCFYGIENPACDIRAENMIERDGKTTFELCLQGTRIPVTLPCVGRHNVLNALAACAVGRILKISPQKCVQALQRYTPSGMRQKIVNYKGYTVVEDCYNASPDSMKAALATLGEYPCDGKRIAVLGDMLELGKLGPQAHCEIGKLVAKNGIDSLLAYGEQAGYYIQGARSAGLYDCIHYEEKEKIADHLREILQPGDVVWIKGSRGMKMEDIIHGLYEEKQDK